MFLIITTVIAIKGYFRIKVNLSPFSFLTAPLIRHIRQAQGTKTALKVNNLEITEVSDSRKNLVYSIFLFLVVALSIKLRHTSLALSDFIYIPAQQFS